MDDELWEARAEVLAAGMREQAARGRDWVQQTQLRLAVEHFPDDQQRHLALAIREVLAERTRPRRPVKETAVRSALLVAESACPSACMRGDVLCPTCRAICS